MSSKHLPAAPHPVGRILRRLDLWPYVPIPLLWWASIFLSSSRHAMQPFLKSMQLLTAHLYYALINTLPFFLKDHIWKVHFVCPFVVSYSNAEVQMLHKLLSELPHAWIFCTSRPCLVVFGSFCWLVIKTDRVWVNIAIVRVCLGCKCSVTKFYNTSILVLAPLEINYNSNYNLSFILCLKFLCELEALTRNKHLNNYRWIEICGLIKT